jgi:hypothetical protein
MLDQRIEKPEPEKFQPSLLDVIAKLIFYSHLVLSVIYASIIIGIYPYIVSPTITFSCIVIYGYMIAWVAIINILLLVNLWLK